MKNINKIMLIFIAAGILTITSCRWSLPRNSQYVGAFGFSTPIVKSFGINLFVIGIEFRLGSQFGLGVYNYKSIPPVKGLLTGYAKYIPHIHIEFLTFKRFMKGIQLLIFSIGI